MKLIVTTAVVSDDGNFKRESTNDVNIATDLPGMDAAVLRQEFMAQAESLLRTVGENQVPALYAAVEKDIADAKAAEAPKQAEEQEPADATQDLKEKA